MHKLLPVVALTVLVPTAAWATVTEVQNTDDPTKHPFQQSVFQGSSCDAPGPCNLNFPAIATGTTLVQHFSCSFNMQTGGAVLEAGIFDAEYDGNYIPVTLVGTWEGVEYYSFNADSYLFLKKGDALSVMVDTAGEAIGGFACTASGYYL